MHVGNGADVFNKTVRLYDLNFVLKYTGASSSTVLLVGNPPINFYADMTDGLNSFTSNPSMEPVAPGNYYIRIDNRYARLDISAFNSSYNADFDISYIGTPGTFARIDSSPPGRQIYLGPTYNWIEHTITVKNSFGGGNVIVDGKQYNNIGVNGKPFTWIESSDHILLAIDQTFTDASGNFTRRFNDWSRNSSFYSSSNQTSVTVTGNDTYTANFLNEYNITVKNQFSDGGTGGVITVNSVSKNSVFYTTVEQYQSISITAVPNTTSGMDWTFDHWFDGNTTSSRQFTPDSNRVYAAYFTGKPNNVNRNLQFNSIAGQNVTLYWTLNPNQYITSYKIWRKVKHNGVMGAAVNISTVSSTTTSYIDLDYVITSGYTDDLLYYDVRAFYSIDQTYTDPSYLSIFGKQGIIAPIANKGNEGELFTNIIKKNSLDNYPNPFNPSTIIQYQIKEGGFVSIKVYDYLGREVAVLVNKQQPSGRYSVRFDASNLSSGVYLYTINTNNFNKVKKMILLR